ncbi:SDR family NAD(P)-dependent oxidoreductase [Chlorobium ferrooxidans]|uniref:Short-chain dehydrogenase/reductase SDR n=1 Tax=Chlorobium ferrooxidans DSM 13031 TaxID=377431 RepID=Q0YTW3_9CHLB|nr:SDR family oxidoreductase [Chlorobium ferrooxidans]EAT59789.1 Short-chain dehydrogenase/reductase SDR [Chlorobium ferrooxidans DSM 13031]
MTHAIIIGGSKGLGRVVAQQMKLRGDQISVVSRNRPPLAEEVEGVNYYTADIADTTALQHALEGCILQSGEVNYLIFCQRYRGSGDAWTGEIDVSLTASKFAVEYLQDRFVKGGDCGIVFVSSVFGDRVGEGQPVSYHIGKAGMNHMARYYAVNLGGKGIRTNAVTPFTFLKKESKDFYLNNTELLALYEEIIPLGRMATAEDSANVIAFLCSPAAAFVNGQNIYVDGGLSLVWPETLARKLKSL